MRTLSHPSTPPRVLTALAAAAAVVLSLIGPLPALASHGDVAGDVTLSGPECVEETATEVAVEVTAVNTSGEEWDDLNANGFGNGPYFDSASLGAPVADTEEVTVTLNIPLDPAETANAGLAGVTVDTFAVIDGEDHQIDSTSTSFPVCDSGDEFAGEYTFSVVGGCLTAGEPVSLSVSATNTGTATWTSVFADAYFDPSGALLFTDDSATGVSVEPGDSIELAPQFDDVSPAPEPDTVYDVEVTVHVYDDADGSLVLGTDTVQVSECVTEDPGEEEDPGDDSSSSGFFEVSATAGGDACVSWQGETVTVDYTISNPNTDWESWVSSPSGEFFNSYFGPVASSALPPVPLLASGEEWTGQETVEIPALTSEQAATEWELWAEGTGFRTEALLLTSSATVSTDGGFITQDAWELTNWPVSHLQYCTPLQVPLNLSGTHELTPGEVYEAPSGYLIEEAVAGITATGTYDLTGGVSPDGLPLYATSGSDPGPLTVNPDGSFIFESPATFAEFAALPDTAFEVTITDGFRFRAEASLNFVFDDDPETPPPPPSLEFHTIDLYVVPNEELTVPLLPEEYDNSEWEVAVAGSPMFEDFWATLAPEERTALEGEWGTSGIHHETILNAPLDGGVYTATFTMGPLEDLADWEIEEKTRIDQQFFYAEGPDGLSLLIHVYFRDPDPDPDPDPEPVSNDPCATAETCESPYTGPEPVSGGLVAVGALLLASAVFPAWRRQRFEVERS